ncbi:MAG: threonine ammonia-lyase [Dictyoglomus sp. NZ13-RE01]|nr:MAG: threonine ammonia-lyase [Dictyoglomus sp. NZ13-RE01]
MISLKEVKEAQERISPYVHHTPLSYSQTFSDMTKKDVYLKFENLQKTGSFKIRGAINYIRQIDKKVNGIIAASAGNHAQGVAYGGKIFSIPTVIVMPENTPIIKVASTKSYSAKVILYGSYYDEAYNYALKIAEEEKLEFIHPFDDPKIIAGQGTVGLEILSDMPDIQAIIVPIGGGGLSSGVCIAIKEQNPNIKIYGVQTFAFPYYYERFKGITISDKTSSTIAEGIAVKKPGKITQEILDKYIDDMFIVDEMEIAQGILYLLERAKSLVEGAGAVTLSALLKYSDVIKEKKIALILSGGNIDVSLLSKILEYGLIQSGRLVHLKIELLDIPGKLAEILEIIAEEKANINSIHQDRANPLFPIGKSTVEITIETKNFEQINRIFDKIKNRGYKVEISEKGE